jgi:hypothetical protein
VLVLGQESFQELWDTVYGAVDEIWRQPTAQDKLEVRHTLIVFVPHNYTHETGSD